MYPKIVLHADNTDITLLQVALDDLLERNNKEGDQYGTSTSISALIAQLQEIKGAN
jgi:hypothetical protein